MLRRKCGRWATGDLKFAQEAVAIKAKCGNIFREYLYHIQETFELISFSSGPSVKQTKGI